MTDNSGIPIDLRVKRKYMTVDDDKILIKKKSRTHNNEIPLDLSVKTQQFPLQSPMMPFYNPANLLFNSSALLYDLFVANINSYCQQQQQQLFQQQQSKSHTKTEPISSKSTKISPTSSIRPTKTSPSVNKHESYACSCGERYSSVAQLVSHLKATNHHAQLSSAHDEVAKLVRGQDIWLSRDTNPANQILKCLRCSSSFETLPDLTAHMMKTNHFTQLLSTTSSPSNVQQQISSKQQQPQLHSPTKTSTASARSTCLVCSQQFVREVDLVDHLQRSHQIRFNCTTCGMYFENESIYKEHLIKEMHHKNGKANRNRDYFIGQCKTLQQRSSTDQKFERSKSQSPIDKDVERVASDLLDRIDSNDGTAVLSNNALLLLQNFVIQKTPSTAHSQIDMNNNFDDESSKEWIKNLSDETPSSIATTLSENPLLSLEKMLVCSTQKIESSPATSINSNGFKKKKFDKYRLFAEKMVRSSLS